MAVGRTRAPVANLAATLWKSAKVSVEGEVWTASGEASVTDEVRDAAAALPKSLAASILHRRVAKNLGDIGIALHAFHDASKRFPCDLFGRPSTPWSWRVQILPYASQEDLYFKLDFRKTWDDPANLKVLEGVPMPKVFEHPGRPAPKGHTYFRIFSLPKGTKEAGAAAVPILEEGKTGPNQSEVHDGLSNTFMVVEAEEAVPWYKPDVLPYDGKLPLPQLGGKDADLFYVLFADGHVRVLKPSRLGEKGLRAYITRAGGEIVPDPDR